MAGDDKANSNEYVVSETIKNGAEIQHTIFAAKMKFNGRTHMATFWYWRKSLWTRWELHSYELKVNWVHQVIDGEVI